MIEVLIGLFPRILFVCCFCISIYRNYLGRGPVGPQLVPSVSEAGQEGQGGLRVLD